MHWLFLSLGNGCQFGLMLLHVSVPKYRHHSFIYTFGLMVLHVSVPKSRHHSLLCMAGVSIPESRNGTAYPEYAGMLLLMNVLYGMKEFNWLRRTVNILQNREAFYEHVKPQNTSIMTSNMSVRDELRKLTKMERAVLHR